MGIRRWFRGVMEKDDSEGNDRPPRQALLDTLVGEDEERIRALGEYDFESYPAHLREQLLTREAVARELLSMEIASPSDRIAAIPRLRDLLRRYPHPLVYETLIHAYIDAGRFDEAKGVAFAARQRRRECARSEYPEIRAEIAHLRDWKPEDIDDMRPD